MLVQDISAQKCSVAPEGSHRSLKLVSRYFDTWRRAGTFCVISSKPSFLEALTDYMVSYGMIGVSCSPESFLRSYSRFVDLKPAFVMMNLDDFDGIGKVYNKIRYFRDERPDVPFVLASHRFKKHDFGDERLPICDISIKTPIDSEISFDQYFMAIWSNNERWIARRSFF